MPVPGTKEPTAGPSRFDRIVAVDWSANSKPKTGADSIWIAEWSHATQVLRSANISTRAAAVKLLAELAAGPGRCLIGVDFSLGFPTGTAAALGLEGVAWAGMWELLTNRIEDDDRNANNRFEVAAGLNGEMSAGPGPFWGCHPSKATNRLTSKKVSCAPLSEWRTVEAELRAAGRRPFSAWQLLGVGAVGSQSLLGIPAMARLLEALAASDRSTDVWPFTSGLLIPSADVVLVEVWPTLVDLPDRSHDVWNTRVRDQVQVETLVSALATGDLGPWFAPDVPAGSRNAVVAEEGWILGA